MVFPTKKIYVEYHIFVVEMYVENMKINFTFKNLNVICDLEFILRLPCTLTLLECVHTLIKIA
jgi:hypothetical protein